jgi:uncharacterized membrane protein YozB (DUF420 family)
MPAVMPDLWSLLMALAVIVAPLGLAWALLAWSERRKRHGAADRLRDRG